MQPTRQSSAVSVLDLIAMRAGEPAGGATARSMKLLPPVDSMNPLWNDVERAAVESRLRAAIVGSDATVQAGLEKLVRETRADEVIVATDAYEQSDRIESYQRVVRIAATIKSAPNVEA